MKFKGRGRRTNVLQLLGNQNPYQQIRKPIDSASVSHSVGVRTCCSTASKCHEVINCVKN